MAGGKIKFMTGAEACVKGALMAGCKFFAGYPITPSSEIMEGMAEELPKRGGIFIQMEDEIAAINAVIGASIAGLKAMTATSGPGFSLMQEAIGYAYMVEVPCLIVDVQRAGPATGQATKGAQGDFYQSRWGSHGDRAAIVLSPSSAEEFLLMTVRGFNLAEKFRVPVVVLADEQTAHIAETVFIPEGFDLIERRKAVSLDEPFFGHVKPNGVPPMPELGIGLNVLYTGSTHDEWGFRKTSDKEAHRKLVTRLFDKIEGRVDEIADFDLDLEDGSRIGLVSYGFTARSAFEAVRRLRERGVKVSHLRLKALWPFPDRAVLKLAEHVDKVVVPEMNLGQVVREVQRASRGLSEVLGYGKIGGGEPITASELVEFLARC